MYYIASTRFNNATWDENILYRRINKISGTIYGSISRICDKYPLGCNIFIVEMNNEMNRIEGIGLIKNRLITDKKYNIYSDTTYNRFIYKGDYWLSRDELTQDIQQIFDMILFKGRSHLKRIHGISILKHRIYQRWKLDEVELKNKIRECFTNKFFKKDIFDIYDIEEEEL
jgi:hypothetical protein